MACMFEFLRRNLSPIVIANWKMNLTYGEALLLANFVERICEKNTELKVVICPSSIYLYPIYEELKTKPRNLALGLQNTMWEEDGIFTGEISIAMVKRICRYVIVGHSERRRYFGETDEQINKKVRFSLFCGVTPIICVGEEEKFHLEDYYDREVDRMKKQGGILSQIDKALERVAQKDLEKVIIAYEPVWAIGSGNNATGAYAAAICYIIKNHLATKYSEALAKEIAVIYGGSVNSKNVTELTMQPSIEGLLVGGESLNSKEFAKICEITSEVKSGRAI